MRRGAFGDHLMPDLPPADAPLCILCHDSGLHRHTGEWAFCLCPAGVKRRAEEPGLADESNETLRRLEGKMARK
jgi:hypothetical protein